MLTPPLSGCSIVVQPLTTGSIKCYHFQPTGVTAGVAGRDLAANLRNNNAFNGCTIYGADIDYNSDDRYVTIIGVKQQTGWKIYAQKQIKTFGAGSICKVKRIYPR